MKSAPKKLPREYMTSLARENIMSNEINDNTISLSVLQSILDSRISQMTAITLPNEKNKLSILNEIGDVPNIYSKLTSLLDFLIGQIAQLSAEAFGYKVELEQALVEASSKKISEMRYNDSYTDKRINEIAEKLSCKPESIEKYISDLMNEAKNKPSNFRYENDYNRAIAILKCKEGELSSSLDLIIKDNSNLRRIHTQDRGIRLKQDEELKKYQKIENIDFQPKVGVKNLMHSKGRDLQGILNTLNDLSKQVNDLSKKSLK